MKEYLKRDEINGKKSYKLFRLIQIIIQIFQVVVRFKLLDPDPHITYGYRSGSRRANNLRIRLDPVPDPKH